MDMFDEVPSEPKSNEIYNRRDEAPATPKFDMTQFQDILNNLTDKFDAMSKNPTKENIDAYAEALMTTMFQNVNMAVSVMSAGVTAMHALKFRYKDGTFDNIKNVDPLDWKNND